MRYRGAPDPKTGLRPDDAKAESAAALKRMNDLRDRMRSLQKLHEQVREELTSEVVQATVHVGRLAMIAAKAADEHAAVITTFARAICHDRPSFRDLPAAPAAMELPSRAEVAELKGLAEPILALARRAPPPTRPGYEYSSPR